MNLLPRSELRRKNDAQYYLITELANAVPGFTQFDWDRSGYKRVFDSLWSTAHDRLKDDHEALLLCILAHSSKVSNILDGRYAGPLDEGRRPGRMLK